MVEPPPGLPMFAMETPATLPNRAPAAELAGTFSISSVLRDATVTESFFLDVAPATPVTTTSSKAAVGES